MFQVEKSREIVFQLIVGSLTITMCAAAAEPIPSHYNMVLIGRKGSGKSSTGNTILGNEDFTVQINHQSLIPCQKRKVTIANIADITVIDTPGLFDVKYKDHEVETELSRIFKLIDGVDVFLLVLRIGRFTDELRNLLKHINILFGPLIWKNTVAIFTGLEDLDYQHTTFTSYLDELPENVKKLLPEHKVGFRNRANDAEKKHQAAKLLEHVVQLNNATKFKRENLPRQSLLLECDTRQNLPLEVRNQGDAFMANQKTNLHEGDDLQRKGPQQVSLLENRGDLVTGTEDFLRLAVAGREEDGTKKLATTVGGYLGLPSISFSTQENKYANKGSINGRDVVLVTMVNFVRHNSQSAGPKLSYSAVSTTAERAEFQAVFLNLSVGSNEADMVQVIKSYIEIFGDEAMKYTWVIFSNQGQFRKYGQSFPKYIKRLPQTFRKLIEYQIENDMIFEAIVSKCDRRGKIDQDRKTSDYVKDDKVKDLLERVVTVVGKYPADPSKLALVERNKHPGSTDQFRSWVRRCTIS